MGTNVGIWKLVTSMDRWTTPLFSILISVLNSSYLDFVLELQPPSTDPDLSYVSLTLRLVLGFFPSLKLLGMNLGLPLKILKGFLRNMWEHFIRLGHIHTSCHVIDNVVQPYAGEIFQTPQACCCLVFLTSPTTFHIVCMMLSWNFSLRLRESGPHG